MEMGEDGGHRTRSTQFGQNFLCTTFRFLPLSSVVGVGGGKRERAIWSLFRHDLCLLGGYDCSCGALFCQANDDLLMAGGRRAMGRDVGRYG